MIFSPHCRSRDNKNDTCHLMSAFIYCLSLTGVMLLAKSSLFLFVSLFLFSILSGVTSQPYRPQLACDCSSWQCDDSIGTYRRSSTVIPADVDIECNYVQYLDYTEAGDWSNNRKTVYQVLRELYNAFNGLSPANPNTDPDITEGLLEYFGGAYYFDADSAPVCGCDDDFCFAGTTYRCLYDGGLYNIPQDDIAFSGDICGEFSNSYAFVRTWTRASCEFFPIDNSYSLTQLVRWLDTISPELFVPEDMQVECTQYIDNMDYDYLDMLFGSARATDLCSQPILIQTTSQTGSDPTFCQATYTRTWNAWDGCNNSTASQTITVVDTTPPILVSYYGEDVFELDCSVDVNNNGSFLSAYLLTPFVYDICNSVTTPTYNDVSFNGETKCVNDGSMTRTWSASDSCGNEGYYVQTYYLRDRTPPFDTLGSTLEDHFNPRIACGLSDVQFSQYDFGDDCSAIIYSAYTDSIIGDKNILQEVVRQYTVEDGCGNSVSFADHYFFTEESQVIQFQFGTTSYLDRILNADKGVNIAIPFTIDIVVCGPTFLVFDIGPANFISTDASITCQPTQGNTGIIVCPLTGDLDNTPRTLTILVPTSYQPDNLEISGNIYLSDGFQYNTGYTDDLTASLVLSFY